MMWPRFKQWLQNWPSRLVFRYLSTLFLICFAITNYLLWTSSQGWDVTEPKGPVTIGPKHPIKKLMADARARHESIVSKRSYDLYDAAERYRARRGRHPPPGFDKWVEAALASDAIIVEDYFDRIYKDLSPYWALDAHTLARRASAWHWVVKVRNGEATGVGDTADRVPWLQHWTELVKEFAKDLPDVDMPINYMDEPRLLVPFEDLSSFVDQERSSRRITPMREVFTKFKSLSKLDDEKPQPYDPYWFNSSANYWELARVTCDPNAPSRNVQQVSDLRGPVEYPSNWDPEYAYKGYVKNWTASQDPCLQPHLRQMHGSFVAPLSLSTSKELIPLFGGSKLPMNNEILIPGAMYLTEDEFYSGGEKMGPAWHAKKTGIVWRGDASGGEPRADVWHRFHRHRLMQMLNGSYVHSVEHDGVKPKTFQLPDPDHYNSTHRATNTIGQWLKEISDCGFKRLLCEKVGCDHFAPYFHELKHMTMKDQYRFKFLPDTDGNSFSARFRGFLRSSSMPLKATIYAEWHDDRLTPWVHFVPFDNTFQDLYPILEFFTDEEAGGDTAARFIAERGKDWASQVLRRKDMALYTWRLLLEWARVCDEDREKMGFIRDLVESKKDSIR
ncbi:hypothetical protein NW762_004854 [Fusarium torreyae]|uniref:Glycosyl transferase CAP10 domain-containing protein n=1 Tax=Fusarium torreyae TaxID=1237075 RepID=A0A9W8VG30_9HYPO|nr:hypothetical protein NW762_004854 [Fusarium torreyae]